ncbi:helix-turn-helix domain-containing protein [Bacillus cereus]
MNIIGERIFELRKERRLTQEKIGENIGVSKQTISKYEKGTKNPLTREH